jgi:hypothetical protein
MLPDLTWFEAGSAIFDGVLNDSACYPPLDDVASQREWLSGFIAAWSARPDGPGLPTVDPRHGTLSDVLARVLKQDRPNLLTPLQVHLASLQPPDRPPSLASQPV